MVGALPEESPQVYAAATGDKPAPVRGLRRGAATGWASCGGTATDSSSGRQPAFAHPRKCASPKYRFHTNSQRRSGVRRPAGRPSHCGRTGTATPDVVSASQVAGCQRAARSSAMSTIMSSWPPTMSRAADLDQNVAGVEPVSRGGASRRGAGSWSTRRRSPASASRGRRAPAGPAAAGRGRRRRPSGRTDRSRAPSRAGRRRR